jgi:hypothetical protein
MTEGSLPRRTWLGGMDDLLIAPVPWLLVDSFRLGKPNETSGRSVGRMCKCSWN